MGMFKKWLYCEKDQIDQTIQQTLGNVPGWVSKDLFRDNWLKRQARSGASRTPFSDWRNSPQVQAFKNVVWPQKPACLSVGPTHFHEQTLTDMVVRRFGRKAVRLKNAGPDADAAKTRTQCDIMAKTPGCRHAPVILVAEGGKYRLLEGWHRTMCKLLSGAPQDKVALLDDPSLTNFALWDALQFDSWTPVQINAYVGQKNDQTAALPDTGPTGAWTPKLLY